MELKQAQELALELIKHHELHDWRFKFDRSKNRLGSCKHYSKVITLSESITKVHSEHEVKDTILHEIAHALVGPQHKHDAVWRNKAIEIGCNGKRCGEIKDSHLIGHLYVAECPACNAKYYANRKRKRKASCNKCSPRFDTRFILNFTPNK